MRALLEHASWQATTESAHREVWERVWDAVIIGAGPAGSVAAIHLARKGRRVLLLDKHRFPRDKVCGDGLLQDAQAVLQRVGLLDDANALGHRAHELSVHSPRGIECRLPGDFLILRRRLLDALLAHGAVAAGAVFCQGQVRHVQEQDDGLVALDMASGQRCRARVAVIATGACVDLLTKLGCVTRRQASGVALRCYVRSSIDLARLVVVYERGTAPGYSWIFPMGDGLFNVGCSSFYRGRAEPGNLRAMFQSFCRGFAIARELFEHGDTLTPPRGALLRCGLSGVSAAGKRLLVIGEAAGSTYPSTGEGIGKAMETGELAALAIDEDLGSPGSSALDKFPATLESRWRRRFEGYQRAARWLARPWLNDLVAWRGRQSPGFRAAMANVFHADADPGDVFSLGNILKSFWR